MASSSLGTWRGPWAAQSREVGTALCRRWVPTETGRGDVHLCGILLMICSGGVREQDSREPKRAGWAGEERSGFVIDRCCCVRAAVIRREKLFLCGSVKSSSNDYKDDVRCIYQMSRGSN